jgi:hypothetical protein
MNNTLAPSCGNRRHHDCAGQTNRNGTCRNADSHRYRVVTGAQGHCGGHGFGEWLNALPMTLEQVKQYRAAQVAMLQAEAVP